MSAMKHVYALAAAVLALGILGCGGRGTGGAPVVVGPATVQIEAIAVRGGEPQPGVVQDPRNIEAREQVVFQLVSYSADGTRTVLPASGWVTNDTTEVFGRLANDSGLFTARDRETVQPLTVAIEHGGQIYSAHYEIKPRQIRLIGRVVDEANPAQGIRGVQVIFYGEDGRRVGEVISSFDGWWRASVPVDVDTLQVNGDTIPASHYRSFRFAGPRYDAGSLCRAPLPIVFVSVPDQWILDERILIPSRNLFPERPGETGCPVE
jgi:hypothetical protein